MRNYGLALQWGKIFWTEGPMPRTHGISPSWCPHILYQDRAVISCIISLVLGWLVPHQAFEGSWKTGPPDFQLPLIRWSICWRPPIVQPYASSTDDTDNMLDTLSTTFLGRRKRTKGLFLLYSPLWKCVFTSNKCATVALPPVLKYYNSCTFCFDNCLPDTAIVLIKFLIFL